MSEEQEYITVEEAAQIAGLTTRQIHRYGETSDLPRKKSSKRYLYERAAVEALAAKLAIGNTAPKEPKPPKVELVPQGQMFEALQRQHAEMLQMAARLGALQNELEAQKALADSRAGLDEQLRQTQAERDELRRQLDELQSRRPWWRRLMGGD